MKMCFLVEVYVVFVLHNYYDIDIIFFVLVGLERKVFAIPQLSPTTAVFTSIYLKLITSYAHISISY